MSYRYAITETTKQNLRRIAGEQIDKAMRDLVFENIKNAGGIHEARKEFKKIRALLRLVRPALGNNYTRLNGMFRGAGREFSDFRDAKVMAATCSNLENHFKPQAKKALFAGIQSLLDKRREDLMSKQGQIKKKVQRVRDMLNDSQKVIASCKMGAEGFDAVGGGLTRIYRRGRKAFVNAYDTPSMQNFHDWRKRVKDYLYHMRLLRDMWPPVIKGCCFSLEDLSHILGDEHDLSILSEYIDGVSEAHLNSEDRAVLKDLITLRQSELRASARARGKRLYAEKPKAFRTRFEQYWLAWS
ncbi:MAG: CHAD domain-containing protein [Chitinivibrionales bacterium]|nr:CHAD domain-containing protein [Chitinivibrionales bacterium]